MMLIRINRGLFACITVFLLMLASADRMEAKNKRGDLIVMMNGDRFTGEVKKLENGVLYIETDYISGSVGLDWSKVDKLQSSASFQLLLNDGRRMEGTVSASGADKSGKQFLINENDENRVVPANEVVEIHSQERKFWSQVTGSINLGYSFTSGNQQSSLTSDAKATYLSTRFFGGAGYTASFGNQEGATPSTLLEVQSLDGIFFNRSSFLVILADFLHSTQQDLNLRTTLGSGYGRDVWHSKHQKTAWVAGLAYTNEHYKSKSDLPTQNIESFLGFQYQQFRFDRYQLDARFLLFPGITDAPRVRTSANAGFSIKLVNKFRTNLRFWDNFDSRPPFNTKRNEFGISNTLGLTF